MNIARKNEFRIPEQNPSEVAASFTPREIADARGTHYPGWWTTGPLEEVPGHLRPLYIVRGVKGRSRDLAIAAKPPLVRAVIVGS